MAKCLIDVKLWALKKVCTVHGTQHRTFICIACFFLFFLHAIIKFIQKISYSADTHLFREQKRRQQKL